LKREKIFPSLIISLHVQGVDKQSRGKVGVEKTGTMNKRKKKEMGFGTGGYPHYLGKC